jgi:hypothetical protein
MCINETERKDIRFSQYFEANSILPKLPKAFLEIFKFLRKFLKNGIP